MEGPNDNIFILQDGRGKCFICKVDFTSDKSAKEHLSGEKHMKKVTALQLALNRPQATSLPTVNQPISKALASGGLTSLHKGDIQENLIQIHGSAASTASHQGFMENLTFQSEAPKRGPNEEAYVMQGSRGTCFVCNVEMTSLEHARSHLNGQKHLKKCASLEKMGERSNSSKAGNPAHHLIASVMPNSNTNGVLMCRVCEVPFSCLANAEEHFVSDKHKKKLAQKENLTSNLCKPLGRRGCSSSISDQTDLKLPVLCDSPFTPLRNLSSEGPVSESNLIRPFTTKEDNRKIHLPVPLKATLEPQPSSNTQDQFNYFALEEFENKGCNSPKNLDITGGNLSCDVAEISKVKNKEVLSTCLPCDSSSQTFSIIDNTKQSRIAVSHNQNLALSKRSHGEEFNGQSQNEGHPINSQFQNSLFKNNWNQTLQLEPVTSPRPVYYFDSQLGRGFCNACNVEITSTQFADQHLNGQKHKKKAAYWESAHQQVRLQPLATSTPLIFHSDPDTAESHTGQRSSPQGFAASPGNTQGITSPAQDLKDETCSFNGVRGFCFACKIEISSLQHYDQHRLGKPHSRNRQRYLLSQQGIEYPLYCETCKKAFTGQESAQQHFSSARHKNKVEIFGKGGREVERLQDGRMIMSDSQIWYVCDVCECPLNTREQFEIHKESPRHKKALESKVAKDKIEFLTSKEQRPQHENLDCSAPLANFEAVQSTRFVTQDQLERKKKDRESVLESNLQHLLFKPHTVTNSTLIEGYPNNSTSARERELNFEQTEPKVATPCVQPIAVKSHSLLPTERYRFSSQSEYTSSGEQQGSTPLGARFYQTVNYPSACGGVQSASNLNDRNNTSGHCENRLSAATINEDSMQNSKGSQGTRTNSRVGFENLSEGGFCGIARQPSLKRTTSNRSSALPFRDISTMEQRHSSDEEWNDSTEDVDREVERANLNISGSEDTALASGLERVHVSEDIERSTMQGFRYYCRVCDKHMNTKDNCKDHLAGKRHKFYISTSLAHKRILPAIRSVITEKICERALQLTKDTPRVYQIELLTKAMARDTVIYLPTGTGKTLVAVLTMGLMLQENQTRPILFLVDKVLLVLQQEKYIREQFEGKTFRRPAVKGDDCFTERELLVMVICGGLFSKRDIPIYKHDIIVTTADFCMNMLNRGWIFWDDFSLVILDEVHHCHKSHPYLKLFAKYHNQRQQQSPMTETERSPREHNQNRRLPKVLGLSASPASKDTVAQTHNMLKNLLANLGGAHIAMVEENVEELDKYQSSAKVVPICVPMSNNEIEFTLHLLEYSLMCYVQLAYLCPELKDFKAAPYSYFASAVQGTEEDITATAERLMTDMEPLMEITNCIFMIKCPQHIEESPERKLLFDHLKIHLTALLLIVGDIGSNSKFVTDTLLKELEPSDKVRLFEKHSLPCKEMYHKVKHFADYGSKDMTMYTKLTETLSNPAYINWSDSACKALVLTQRRLEARQLAQMLKETDFVKDKNLQVTHLVGHGKNAQDGGMVVKKQKKVLDNQHRYHLLVATSIMEEGVDFQTLQLVVCMNPPTSVRALVQIRGRARCSGSHFVILCKIEEEMQKLKTLLQQEKNMLEAAKLCLREDRLAVP